MCAIKRAVRVPLCLIICVFTHTLFYGINIFYYMYSHNSTQDGYTTTLNPLLSMFDTKI